MRVPWLGDVLRDAGLRVATPVGNPVGRGREMQTVYGVVCHDTVTTTAWSDLAVAKLLRDGRPDLSGPLSQLGLRRDGTVDWIADGRSNHNGLAPVWKNDAIGIEVYAAGGLSGRTEPWNDRQYETVVVACRAILDHLDLGRSSYWNPRVAGHKETDPSRKIDPYAIDMDQLRADITRTFIPAGETTPAPEPATTWLEELMAAGEDQLTDIADTLARSDNRHKNELQLRQRQVEVEAASWVATVRAGFGLDPDPASDVWWAPRLADGRKTVSDVVEALAEKAGT